MKKFLFIALALVAVLAVAVGTAGFLYWRHLQTTPQYSLAWLIDAARRDDQAALDKLIDTDAVVDNFVPQVAETAVELYGRGLPNAGVPRVLAVAAPLMPAVKDRARAELPRLIRRETERFGDVPFVAMVIGADRYFVTEMDGDAAVVRSLIPEQEFEVNLRRNGTGWQVVGVKADALARQIAETIGQQIIGLAAAGDLQKAGETLGVGNLQEVLKQAEQVFR